MDSKLITSVNQYPCHPSCNLGYGGIKFYFNVYNVSATIDIKVSCCTSV